MVSVDRDQALRDQALREYILFNTDYWIQRVSWREGEGMKLISTPSLFAQRFRMLYHFRCLDRDDD